MRILLVSHRFPPEGIAGVERYTAALADELQRSGHRITVVAGTSSAESAARGTARRTGAALPVHRLFGPRVDQARFLAGSAALERAFETVIRRTVPDAVHVNHLIHLTPRLVDVARRHRAAVILSLHDYFFACPRYTLTKRSGELCAGPAGGRECARTCYSHEGRRGLERWSARATYFRSLLATAERVHAPSHHLADYFRPLLADQAKLRVLPLGLPALQTEPARPPRPSDQRRGLSLAYLGVVARHKGVHVIPEAVGLAGLPDVELVVLGRLADAEYADGLRARALGRLRLRLAGEYEPAQLPALLRDVDCVVVPSQWDETFSIVTREALSLGVPALVSKLGAPREVVVDGENGFLFDPFRPDELAVLLRRLANEEGLLQRLRDGARRTRIISMAEHAAAMSALYEEAVDELARRAAAAAAQGSELDALFERLVELGFAEADPPQAGTPASERS
jgi:glycosyltransferase involved in cell wall biosynthesis